ncbi:integrase core domain-containing protein, partial [Candidatus Gracilibacteria bacterium]|nr:integrase core domain-containing protein [Candidatus Gracilibacteria bacterium]
FNTDQGSQFTSKIFINTLLENKIQISMDSRGRAYNNIYIERLWRSLKYENIYLNCYDSLIELEKGINRYFEFYNTKRFHQSLDYNVPDNYYFGVFKNADIA